VSVPVEEGTVGAGGSRRRWRPRGWQWLVVIVALLSPVEWSYGRALTSPGTDSLAIRSVEWLRGHGLGRPVSSAEAWWYTHHQPKVGGAPPAFAAAATITLPAQPLAAPQASPQSARPIPKHLAAPATVRSFALPAVEGEGVWRPAGRLVDRVPAVYTTGIRPDPVHTSLVTGIAWIDPSLVHAVLFAGSQEPGGTWQHQAPVPTNEQTALVAAFNGGFRLRESRGGYYADAREAKPLVDGAASLVIDTAGKMTVGEWGRDVRMSSSIASVRQNLALIVDQGAPVAGLDQNVVGRWGHTLGNRVLVWRSGVGVTANGATVYAAGAGLSVMSLANVLVAAGAVRAMELDINSSWTRFFTYTPSNPGDAQAVQGTKLVEAMRSSPTLYLQPESRDFVALMARQ
jgi:hypothetical protein